MKFILARKLNMTQLFTEDGKAVPVTVLEVGHNKVSALRSKEKDGYEAVQVEMGKKKLEFRFQNAELKIGDEVSVKQFEPGEQVDISGVSKGRGFAGAMKRHGFHGAPASHGHDHPRAVGSIGQRFPQHVRPGLRMAGHMGAAGATVKHSMVIAIEPEKNLIFVKGGVPGAPGALVKVVTTGKKKELAKVAEYGKKEVAEESVTSPPASPAGRQPSPIPEREGASESAATGEVTSQAAELNTDIALKKDESNT